MSRQRTVQIQFMHLGDELVYDVRYHWIEGSKSSYPTPEESASYIEALDARLVEVNCDEPTDADKERLFGTEDSRAFMQALRLADEREYPHVERQGIC